MLFLSLLGLGACAHSTAPDEDGDYQVPTDGMRPSLVARARAQATKKADRMNPRADQAAAFIWFERR